MACDGRRRGWQAMMSTTIKVDGADKVNWMCDSDMAVGDDDDNGNEG